MKLTPKQNELIEEYKRLESKYGKGNVFLRYVNDFWRIRFIIHKIGEKNYLPIYDYKINGRVINSWYAFPKGTNKNDVYDWFNRHYSKGLSYLMEEVKKE